MVRALEKKNGCHGLTNDQLPVIGAAPSPKRPVRKHGEAIELCHHIADRATTHASLNTKPRHYWYFRSAPLDGQGRRMPRRTCFGLSYCRGDSDPLIHGPISSRRRQVRSLTRRFETSIHYDTLPLEKMLVSLQYRTARPDMRAL